MDAAEIDYAALLVPMGACKGRRPVDDAFRVRDQFAAQWILASLPGSASALERELSDREFAPRVDGIKGYRQPESLSHAARGVRMLSRAVVKQARSRLPGFSSAYDHKLWRLLTAAEGGTSSQEFTAYEPEWIQRRKLDEGILAKCWSDACAPTGATGALLERVASQPELTSLALLLECTRCSAGLHSRALARIYCEDLLVNLKTKTGSVVGSMNLERACLQKVVDPLRQLIQERCGPMRVRNGQLLIHQWPPTMYVSL